MIRSKKSSLKRSLGSRSLTRSELETVLHEVEACINSRPLTFVGDEVSDLKPLTPAHFLIGQPFYVQSDSFVEPCSTYTHLITNLSAKNQTLQRFWDMWSTEYIRSLPTYPKCSEQGKIKEGSVVLIADDGFSRAKWPMGVVSEIYPGKDGFVRAVKIRTAKGFLTRPIQRLHMLEIESESEAQPKGVQNDNSHSDIALANENVEQNIGKEDKIQRSSFGRTIKPAKRLDL